jgi:sugar phosphate isomerase/epimerase
LEKNSFTNMNKPTIHVGLRQALNLLCAGVVLMGNVGPAHATQPVRAPDAAPVAQSQAVSAPATLFARTNLVAWCIVPFDAKKRGPEERAAMLEWLGFSLFAYDYRAEHIPTFEAEMEALKQYHVQLMAWWFPGELNDEARLILEVLKKHRIHAHLWLTGGGGPTKDPAEQQARVQAEARRIGPIAEAAARIGCTVALYNHGAWFGEPENQIAIIERLKQSGVTNVGIVYNQHHGHDHLDRFPALLAQMKPYLLALNLNGMTRNGDKIGKKILPLGQGDLDLGLLRLICQSGWRGPIGILNHTDEDAEARLQDNLDGLAWLVAQLEGRPAGPKPQPRSWREPGAVQGSSPSTSIGQPSLSPAFGRALRGGMVVAGGPENRRLPITVECWAKLDSKQDFNILVASDPKASAEHWELYSYAGSGVLSLYQPGRGGEFRSEVNICDSRWHYLAATLEPARVRLYVDGRLVKDAAASPLRGQPVPGGLAFGRLVEGNVGSDGLVDEVRLSRGVREIAGIPKEPFTKDERTVGVWHFDDLVAKAVPPPGAPAATLPLPPDLAPPGSVFARTNLIAWCIVPFDTKKRGPEERAAMLESLGLKKLAYDWRAEHIPTFDAEVAALKRHGVEMGAWWFPGALNTEARAILDCIQRNDIHPQLWVMLEGGPHLRWDKASESTPAAQAAHVERMVAGVKPIAAEAARLGCKVALYNHGGWFGVPENQIQIVERLKHDGIDNVGMVYTQHHGHGEIDRFAELFPRMKPHLLAITLNGMIKDGDLRSHELGTAPLGQGDQDLRLLRIIQESGWHGPVGIILEVNADAATRLRDNLDGLAWLVPQLDGKPAGPRPTPQTWRAPAQP